jgi:hypothetical protein
VFTELAADAQREGRKHQDERLPLSPADHPGLNDFRDGLRVSRVDGIEKNHSVVTKIRAEEWAALALRIEVNFHRAHGMFFFCAAYAKTFPVSSIKRPK